MTICICMCVLGLALFSCLLLNFFGLFFFFCCVYNQKFVLQIFFVGLTQTQNKWSKRFMNSSPSSLLLLVPHSHFKLLSCQNIRVVVFFRYNFWNFNIRWKRSEYFSECQRQNIRVFLYGDSMWCKLLFNLLQEKSVIYIMVVESVSVSFISRRTFHCLWTVYRISVTINMYSCGVTSSAFHTLLELKAKTTTAVKANSFVKE